MLRVDVSPRRKNAPRPAWKVNRAFQQFVRGRPCAADGYGLCEGPVQFAHTPDPATKGMGSKAADSGNGIPLCAGHHARQHNRGWLTFEAECLGGKSAVAMADAYWNAWPGRVAHEARLAND